MKIDEIINTTISNYNFLHIVKSVVSNRWCSNSLSLHFNGHFPGEPGLAGIY